MLRVNLLISVCEVLSQSKLLALDYGFRPQYVAHSGYCWGAQLRIVDNVIESTEIHVRVLASHRTYAVLAALLLAAVVFLNGLGTFHTDIKPEIYIRPWTMFTHYLSSWTSSPYLGSPNFNVGLAPVLLVLSGLRGIGLSPEFAFKTFHLLLLLLAAAGAARLFRALVPQSSSWMHLITAVLFVANPYTVTAGATLAIALPMAFLPWMLLCFAYALQRPTSWAWPALAGIAFFLMSGMNVAVVPLFSLLAIIPLVVALWREHGLTARSVFTVLFRSGLFVILLSMYWLVPAFVAMGTGSQIVEGSETLDGIAKVSSLPEVLRGLGLWPLYGSSSVGPWVPEHAVYLTSPFIVVLTMLWPTLGLLGLLWAKNRLRGFIVVSVLISTIVMVGVFPSESAPASPFGMLLREILSIPALSAFRTTNKIGAVLALALAFGVTAFVVYWIPRAWKKVPLRASITVLISTVFVAWTLPAFVGGLYISPLEIPSYWEEAAASIDRSDQPGTVLVLPGQVRPNFRWTEERPDDVTNSLLDRRAVIPETTPNASPAAVNFLSALDSAFQSGTSASDVVSGMARYLGAGQVLLRHDVVWENTGGARPAQTSRQVGSDPGLYGRENFGENGQNVLSPAMEDPFFFGEQFLPPLQVYDVQAPYKPVRALPLDRGLIVAGDGFAFPQMLSAKMLGSTPLVRYAQDVVSKDFVTALEQSERMVLTDTNMRRNVISNRLTAGHGQLLAERERLGATRTLGRNANDQTIREDEIVAVSTTKSGGVFFDLPYGSGNFAFDGDLATGWRFGDFGTGIGQSITATFDEPIEIDTVQIAQMKIGDVVIDELEVSAGSKKVTVKLPVSGVKKIEFGGVESKQLKVTVKSTTGDGFNFVGISEINVDGLRAEPVARLPLTFSDRWDALDAEGRQLFEKTPMDILMSRVANTDSTADDSETGLDRRLHLPDSRSFTVTGDVRVRGSVEGVYNTLDGYSSDIRAMSSGFYFNNSNLRASRAADNSAATAWVPGGGTRDSWWQIDSPERTIDGVTIVQEEQSVAGQRHKATQVEVLVDNQVVAESSIDYGSNRIDFDSPVRGSSVRVRIVGVKGEPSTVPPKFTRIDTGVMMDAPSRTADPCVTVATIDGRAITMKPVSEQLARSNESGTPWESCKSLAISAGEHRISQSAEFIIDNLVLKDRKRTTNRLRAAPVAEVLKDGDTRKQIRVQGATAGYAVVAGQGSNTNWRARVNGQDIGPAQTLNGYSSGWIIPKGKTAIIDMEYVPQRWSYLALLASGIGLLVALGLAWREFVRGELFIVTRPDPATNRTRPAWLTRPFFEGGLVAGAAVFGGFAGIAGAATFVGVQRWRTQSGSRWLYVGSATVFASIVVYLGVLWRNDLIGDVSADAIALSLWPHYVAVVGLVWVLAGVVWKSKKG